jgi:hypothetical protein
LLVLTEDGVIALSGALSGVVNESKYKLSDKIRNRYILLAKTFGSLYGWQILVYPKENALIVNVPTVEDTGSAQLVMNSQTGAWAEFTNWNTNSFCLYNKSLYGCIGTKTVLFWSGTSDAASSQTGISAEFATAFTNLGENVFKDIKAIRFQTSGNTSNALVQIGISDKISAGALPTNLTAQTVLANTVNTTWFNPPSYGGTWISAYFLNDQTTQGGLLQVNSVEYLYEKGSITSV